MRATWLNPEICLSLCLGLQPFSDGSATSKAATQTNRAAPQLSQKGAASWLSDRYVGSGDRDLFAFVCSTCLHVLGLFPERLGPDAGPRLDHIVLSPGLALGM
jgi:hypothetical protein